MGAAFKNPPDTRATPRLFTRHARYARFDRTNYSKQEMEFIDTQATRLSVTDSQIFDKLKENTAEQIAAAAAFGDLK